MRYNWHLTKRHNDPCPGKHLSHVIAPIKKQMNDPQPTESTSSMTIRQAQNTVDDWIKDIGVRYFSELTNLAQLVEEVGELQRN